MKKSLFFAVFVTLCYSVSAQFYTTQNRPNAIRLFNQNVSRTEIILPKIDGYTLYKADFHTHTIYSDGDVTPRERVREAWYDGLDIIAITDHLEIRTYEKFMLKALAPYSKDGSAFKYAHAGIANKQNNEAPVLSNLNAAYEEAVYYAERENLPIMVVRGTEIWRNPSKIGEYNALFLQDINAICHADLFESFRRVKEQGGLIMHNHPGWSRKTAEIAEGEQQRAYDEGWIDGVEIINSTSLYPTVARRCIEKGLFMAANTDAHKTTAQVYNGTNEFFRTMTFIMAKECSEKSIKEALKERRTIGYSGNHLVGEERYLSAFINAAITCHVVAENDKQRTYSFANNCSVPFMLQYKNNVYKLAPFKTLNFNFPKESKDKKNIQPQFVVQNMWHIDEQHPKVTISVDK